MKIYTELFGGAEDGKPIEINNSYIPMEIRVPIIPDLTMPLEDELEFGDPTQPIPSFKELSYELNKDGKYHIKKETR